MGPRKWNDAAHYGATSTPVRPEVFVFGTFLDPGLPLDFDRHVSNFDGNRGGAGRVGNQFDPPIVGKPVAKSKCSRKRL